ncbi:MAG: enoyl-CoA hydratase-related protein [Chloroflexota bacterium]
MKRESEPFTFHVSRFTMYQSILVQHAGPIATITLNRPESHNAFNPLMVAELTAAFQQAGQDDNVRVVILTGAGRSFCAGADLAAMRATADYTFEENVADGRAIFDLMWAVEGCPRPVVGRVNGLALGGGVGLVSCCDVVVAVERAQFAFSESRLGIAPAVISPFVLAKIGPGFARELFLTGERFDAQRAWRMGLVHHVVPEADLDSQVAGRVEQLLLAAPGAQTAIKELIRAVSGRPAAEWRDYTTQLIAQRRASLEGREGMGAFLEKRQPAWQE